MPRRNRPEELLHRSVIEWLTWQKPNCLWFHPYNGGYRTKAEAGIGKALGVLGGVADLVFVLPGGRVGFIELKAPRPSKPYLSASQKAFYNDVHKLGAWYAVARSIEEVEGTLRAWGVLPRTAGERAA